MSASLTDAQTCNSFRSLAIKNRLAAPRLETTVWPTLTRRSIMTPLIGDADAGVTEIDFGLFQGSLTLG